jgi:hypothetical protein
MASLFVLILAFAGAAFHAWGSYLGQYGMFLQNRQDYSLMKDERHKLESILSDPVKTAADIEDLQRRLEETLRQKQSGKVAPHEAEEDVAGYMEALGLLPGSIEPGNPGSSFGWDARPWDLMALPVRIRFQAGYTDGTALVDALEQATAGDYRVDRFTLMPAGTGVAGMFDWDLSVRLLYYGGQ